MHIVHRDISPSNIFMSKRGDVKLGDFGIAHAQRRESKTQAGTLKGKYGYMSPEQVVGQQVDGRSDLFAVGVVLAEMLMGRRLFTAPADLDVLLMVRDARIERLDKYGRDLPPALDRIVRRALKKDPRERFQSGGDSATRSPTTSTRRGSAWAPPICARSSAICSTPQPEAAERLPARSASRRAARAAERPGRRAPAPPPVATSARRPTPRRGRAPRPDAAALRVRRRPTPLDHAGGDPRGRGAAPSTRASPALRQTRWRSRCRWSSSINGRATPERQSSGDSGWTPVSRRRRRRQVRRPARRAGQAGRAPRARAATSASSSRARPSARPTARATSASSRRCACSAIWPSRARRACCASRCRARSRRSSSSRARPSR